nr:NS3a [Ife virus]
MAVAPYVATAPPKYVGEAMKMSDLSLGILDKAMVNTTGADAIIKDEKASYASFAEALRDSAAMREVKRRVNGRIVPRLEEQLRGLKRRLVLVQSVLVGITVVAIVSSVLNLMGEVKELEDVLHIFRHPICGTLNLLSTSMVVVLNNVCKKMDEEIGRVRRDLVKRKSYIDASSLPADFKVGIDALL